MGETDRSRHPFVERAAFAAFENAKLAQGWKLRTSLATNLEISLLVKSQNAVPGPAEPASDGVTLKRMTWQGITIAARRGTGGAAAAEPLGPFCA